MIGSHETCREWREYERTSTTVLSAYVAPVVDRYLETLRTRLNAKGMQPAPFIMQSNGGVATVAAARRNPAALAESGPASGVLGAAALTRMLERSQVIALDIGGTTAKCSLIAGGAPQITTDYAIEASRTSPGYPLKAPVIDIVEIGTGGGSIAAIDAGGRLRVGPQSAGADPGPIVYGRGGTAPTVTDAHVLTGRIDPALVPGADAGSIEAARGVYAELGAVRGVDALAMASGVLQVAEASMENALKLVSIHRGHDPRDMSLIAYGGGGPLHATALAAALHIPEVIIPPNAAVFSACGMLQTDLRRDLVQSRLVRLDQADPAVTLSVFADLEQDACTAFADDGIDAGNLLFERLAEMRYLGQEHTLRIGLGETGPDAWPERFRSSYEKLYQVRRDLPVEIVTFHLVAYGLITKPALPAHAKTDSGIDAARKGARRIVFDAEAAGEAIIFDRDLLGAGAVVEGPAAIEEAGAVTIVAPGQRAVVDDHGNLVIEVPHG